MKIRSLTYADIDSAGWSLARLRLKSGINLFVGASGSGKTRVLNIVFNLSRFAASDRFANGHWTLHFTHADVDYTWTCRGIAGADDPTENHVHSETLWIGTPDHVDSLIFSRDEKTFRLLDKEVPILSTESTAIYLLREDPAVRSVHEAFARVLRRRFWSEDLSSAISLQPLARAVIKKLDRRPSIVELAKIQAQASSHVLLYLLERYFKPQFELISEHFQRVFPFVSDLRVRSAADALGLPLGSDVPVILVKEKGIKNPVPFHDISSGMQKVLLIITDVVIAPPDLLYMIDEYENSLGVNAINFLPPFLADCGGERQFLITTHHPLLINAVPVTDWLVFQRRGLEIKVTHGEDLEGRYSKSRQQRFIQLVNDPLYTEGVE